ncbi:MAG TPA: ABC transporter ATP-binding protein [Burkholderiaceae bacterium]|nr:ABC transporter ATP-binding protein [Burkholderiaceae bacterium]
MSKPAILNCRGLCKSFGGLQAVKDVSFSVPRGAIHAIIGPNGAGKTTLMNLLAGLDSADSGTIEFDGRDTRKLRDFQRVRSGIARTFQNLRLFPDMSVIENVMVGRHCRTQASMLAGILRTGRSRREEAAIEARACELLDEVGLLELRFNRAGDLPFGKQRLLEIARALASDPVLLLLDEPAAGLNSAEAAGLGRLIQRIRDRGVTVLLVEHHMDLVMQNSDQILVLNFGRVLSQGAPAVIRSDPAVVEAYLGDEANLAESLRA